MKAWITLIICVFFSVILSGCESKSERRNFANEWGMSDLLYIKNAIVKKLNIEDKQPSGIFYSYASVNDYLKGNHSTMDIEFLKILPNDTEEIDSVYITPSTITEVRYTADSARAIFKDYIPSERMKAMPKFLELFREKVRKWLSDKPDLIAKARFCSLYIVPLAVGIDFQDKDMSDKNSKHLAEYRLTYEEIEKL